MRKLFLSPFIIESNKKQPQSRCRGFTLIELMIAVAIIVIITSFVLVSVNKASVDSADAGISLNLSNAKGQSGLFYDSNSDSYGSFTSGVCPATGNTTSSSISIFYDPKIIKYITNAALSSGGVISGSGASIVVSRSSCISNTYSWASAVILKSSNTQAWCVDNSGNSKQETITSDTPSTAYATGGVMTSCK